MDIEQIVPFIIAGIFLLFRALRKKKQPQPGQTAPPPQQQPKPKPSEDLETIIEELLGKKPEPKPEPVPVEKPVTQHEGHTEYDYHPGFETIEEGEPVDHAPENPYSDFNETEYFSHRTPHASGIAMQVSSEDEEEGIDFNIREAIIYSEIMKRPEW